MIEGIDKEFIDKMNARHDLFMRLEAFYEKHKFIPDQYLPDWHTWTLKDRRIPWFKNRRVIRRLKKATKAKRS